MTTDLSKLTAAATKWDDMAGEFKKLETQYERDVHGISLGQTWQGLSADAANSRFGVTLNEYKAEQKEAKAVAALLRDAHTQFVDLRSKLKSVRDDAVKAGTKVSEQGYVSFDTSRLSDGERTAYVHDRSYQESARTAAGEWNQAIAAAVKAVADADDGVRIALAAVVVDSNSLDGTFNGFNSGAKSDVEEYEAAHAKDIATRINSGEKVSAADLAELQRSFRDNSDNKAFSQTFLNGLGPSGTIQLGNNLNDKAHSGNGDQQKLFRSITSGLADTLAGATRPPAFKDSEGKTLKYGTAGYQKAFDNWLKQDDGKFYTEWREGLKKAGVEKFDLDVVGDKIAVGTGHGQEARGYQSLVTLMQQGSGYSPQFMADITDDMIAAEKKDPDIWDLHGKFDGKKEGWFANDPVDGALNLMSRDPDGTTAYLDPGAGGKNDRLEYLLKERDWDTVDTTQWTGNIERTGGDTADSDARTGLGAALEAAATGHPPLRPGQDPWPVTPHTEGQARIMHGVVSGLGPDQSVPENMREPLSRAPASYTEDTHQILGGMGSSQYVNSTTDDGYFRDGDKVHMAVTQKDLAQFMRGLSDDPEAYATLHKAESRFISLEMEKIPQDATGFAQSNPLSNAGAALGAYSAIREDVINDERMTAYSAADWKSKMAYHVIGGAVTPLYFTTAGGVSIAFGDSIQRGVDTWAWFMGNNLKAEADTTANAGIADHYLNATNQMNLMVDSWADDRRDIDADARAGLKSEILHGHDRGANITQKYLTDTTN
ncbi:hypothetical protein [Streptomyces wuyuanensis]|uniref:Uncharacterized protein n=1 Tax=Streptomyces wuyuanensis TaxID=1196353 RepID=A0A1H0B6W0_9ACTN|nr:hypothetical protein [Streptomyces wuyuanensis]SDN41369.1 hypothetical protein SAMN05444921_12687 [Streptomyces wuyuanensis]